MNVSMIYENFGKKPIKLPAMSGAALKQLLLELAKLRAK